MSYQVDKQSTASSDINLSLEVPSAYCSLLDTLEQNGFESWLVGGFVRDSLRQIKPHDCDIATQAPWQQVETLCQKQGYKTYQTGIQHGTLSVNVGNAIVEVTTFRKESSYSDHRHPDSVEFVDSIITDLARRDFTINAMAYHPKRGLYDPFGGREDLISKTIRCVGDPCKRFDEDALRIMRALRFSAQLGFTLEGKTEEALFLQRSLLKDIAVERISAEIEKMLCASNIAPVLLRYVDVLGCIIPELVSMKNFDQRTPYHVYDVLEHTAHVVEYTRPQPTLRWAALFHDSGKPQTFSVDEQGIGHMYGHPEVSESIFLRAAKQLRLPKRLSQDVALLIRYHDTFPEPTEKSVRTLYRHLNCRDDLFYDICNLMRADSRSQAPWTQSRLQTIDEIEACFNRMQNEHAVFSVKDLAVSGNDIIACGIEPGPCVGTILEQLCKDVEEKRTQNTRAALIARTREIIQSTQENG